MEKTISIRQKMDELQKLHHLTQKKILSLRRQCPHTKIRLKQWKSACAGWVNTRCCVDCNELFDFRILDRNGDYKEIDEIS